MDVEKVGIVVRVKLGDSRSNRPRDILLPHFVTEDDGRRPMGPVVIRKKTPGAFYHKTVTEKKS